MLSQIVWSKTSRNELDIFDLGGGRRAERHSVHVHARIIYVRIYHFSGKAIPKARRARCLLTTHTYSYILSRTSTAHVTQNSVNQSGANLHTIVLGVGRNKECQTY